MASLSSLAGFVVVPLGQVLIGPVEWLVDVTEITGIDAPGFQLCSHAGRIDLVTTDGAEQAVGRVRHVAVVATAAG